jgi:hypothetical protein
MGVDIYSQTGVVFTIDEAVVKLIPTMKTAEIRKMFPLIESAAEDVLSLLHDREFAGAMQARLASLRTTKELRAWFVDLVHAFVVDDDGYIEHADVLSDVLLTIMGPKNSKALPDFAFEYFNSGRYSGWDVPLGVPCVVFDAAGLFEEKMTAAGRKLAKHLGIKSLSSTPWTVYSV